MDFHNYSSTSPNHRKKILTCKSNAQCSVFGCHNRSEAGLYLLPKENNLNLRKQWIHVLRMKKVSKNTMVCGKHFNNEDFMTPTKSSKGKIRRLRKSAIPSQNLPKSVIDKSPSCAKKNSIRNREERSIRRRLLMDERPQIVLQPEPEQILPETDDADIKIDDAVQSPEIIDALAEPDCKSTKDAEVQCNILKDGFDSGIRFIDFISTDKKMSAFTGIKSVQKFNAICEAVELLLSTVSDKKFCSGSTMCTPQCMLLTFVKLKMNISFSGLAAFFNISEELAAEIFFSTIDLLYIVLKDGIRWFSQDNIRNNMPNVFKKLFPTTRVILDCMVIDVQHSSCLKCKTRTYSQYKCSHTVKVLIGISPSGVITFVSEAFGGRISDKYIFMYSKILENREQGDAVMVHKDVSVQDECTRAGIQLIQPPLTPTECEQDNAIAKARILVEGIMQKIKIFQILDNEISLTFLEPLDKIIKIVCAVVNLSEPILSDRHFDPQNTSDDFDINVSDSD